MNTSNVPGGKSFPTILGGPADIVEHGADGTLSARPSGKNITYTGMVGDGAVGCRAGIPNHPKVCPLRPQGASTTRLADGRYIAAMMAYPANADPNASLSYSLYAFVSSDDGYTWDFSSVIAADIPGAEEGPCENDITLMPNGSVICVFRTDGGDGQPCGGQRPCNNSAGHRMAPYGVAISNNDGESFFPVKLLPDQDLAHGIQRVVAALPRIKAMGPSLVICGGRPSGQVEDPMIWLNSAGDAEEWIPYSISFWHNRLLNQSGTSTNSTPYETRSWPFDAGINHSQFPRQSTSYNSLIKTSDTSAFAVYSQWLHHHGNEWRADAMHFDLTDML